MTDILVLSYHAVSPSWPAALAVTPDELERQLRWLLERGYRGATVHEAVHAPPAPRTLAVTFDDAYRSVVQAAQPILSRLGLPATVFIPTDFPDGGRPMAWPGIDHWIGGPHEAELTPASWDELGALAESGWEMGSHTCSHPWLTTLSDADLDRELSASRARCEERLGTACRSFAYPYGDHDARVVHAVRAAGYSVACTVPDAIREAEKLAWPRIGLYNGESMLGFRVKTSLMARRFRRTRVGARSVAGVRRLRLQRRRRREPDPDR
jgi:peptidoglycan/xylan/chitin deacetylase (PgdA/CDA1 family)